MKAVLAKIDRDYNSYVGDVFVEVNSWTEAEKYAEDKDWSGYYYFVSYVVYNNEVFENKKALTTYLEKEKQLDNN